MALDNAPLVPSSLRLDNNNNNFDVLERTNDERRRNRTLQASQDHVNALFGGSLGVIGDVYGDVFCTHNRIRGRLFLTDTAVLFYTSLLGLERKISVNLPDVYDMELYRTTSIRLHTLDGETYIFRSFVDRVQVLQTLQTLRRHATPTRAPHRQRAATAPSSPMKGTPSVSSGKAADPATVQDMSPESTSSTSPPLPSPPRLRQVHSASTVQQDRYSAILVSNDELPNLPPPPPPPPTNPIRRRAVSDSNVRATSARSRRVVETQRPLVARSEKSRTLIMDTSLRSIDEDGDDAWDRLVEQHGQNAQLSEIGIESLVLPCSLDAFHSQFLADDAPHSLVAYQRNHVRDHDVQVTPWQQQLDGTPHHSQSGQETKHGTSVWRRTLTFTHPIKTSAVMMGPTEAYTTRNQTLRWIGARGLYLENVTTVQGIPAADSFYVQDEWLVEDLTRRPHKRGGRHYSDGGERVQVATRFGAIFTKRTLLKTIIEKSIRRETKDWFAGFGAMCGHALAGRRRRQHQDDARQDSDSNTTTTTADVVLSDDDDATAAQQMTDGHNHDVTLLMTALQAEVRVMRRWMVVLLLLVALLLTGLWLQVVWWQRHSMTLVQQELQTLRRWQIENAAITHGSGGSAGPGDL